MEKARNQANRQANIAAFKKDNVRPGRFPNEPEKCSKNTKNKAEETNDIANNQIFDCNTYVYKIILKMPVGIAMKFASWNAANTDVGGFFAAG